MAMTLPPFVPQQVMNDFETKRLKRTAVYDEVMSDMLARDKSLDVRFFDTALRLFRKPVLVIWGDQDQIFNVDVTRQLMENLPDGELVILKGVGHTPVMEAPWPTARAMESFLSD
jgi:pimeloyl-ACP methyl ester carboxylesterase